MLVAMSWPGRCVAVTVSSCFGEASRCDHSQTPNPLLILRKNSDLGKSHLKKQLLNLSSASLLQGWVTPTLALAEDTSWGLQTPGYTSVPCLLPENTMTPLQLPTVALSEVTSNAQTAIIYQHRLTNFVSM